MLTDLWRRVRGRLRRRRQQQPKFQTENCARVRVYANVGGQRKRMVGYVPNALLSAVRNEISEAKKTGNAKLEASPLSAERVRAVVPQNGKNARRGWRIRLGVSVRSERASDPATAPAKVCVELKELLSQAEAVARARAEKIVSKARTSEEVEAG